MNVSRPTRRPRVMLGTLGPMTRVGMDRLLGEDGIEIVGGPLTEATRPPEVAELQPDVVVLDLDRTESQRLCVLARSVWPSVKVVLWACTEDVMEVIDPGSTRPRWAVANAPEDLLAELSSLNESRPEE